MSIVAIVMIALLAGYNLYQSRPNPLADDHSHQPMEIPASIESVSDINASSDALDRIDLDESADTTLLEQTITQL